jgi:hypothetical protein
MAAVVGAVVGAFSGMKSMQAQKKAMKAQQRAAEEMMRLQKMADLRERRRMLREAAIARGQAVNIAAQIGGGSGPTAGSSVISGLGGIQNQVLSGLGFAQTSQSSALLQQRYLNKAAKYQSDASKWSAIGSAAMSIGQALSQSGSAAMGAS